MSGKVLRWLRAYIRKQDSTGQIIIALAFVIMTLRIIMPVRHLPDGYVIYWHPWREFNTCYISSDCNIDRSRTAIESGSVVLLAMGALYARHKRRR